jgi:hypothetical protein
MSSFLKHGHIRCKARGANWCIRGSSTPALQQQLQLKTAPALIPNDIAIEALFICTASLLTPSHITLTVLLFVRAALYASTMFQLGLIAAASSAILGVSYASTLQPPVLPLIVRNPYLSTWLGNARDEPWHKWPMFWTGNEVHSFPPRTTRTSQCLPATQDW